MESKSKFVIPLDIAWEYSVSKVGGKSRNVSICRKEGFTVPDGFCISTDGYQTFIRKNRLSTTIDLEVMRKPYEDMRWEEIWDAALRIRSSFMKAPMPDFLEREILNAISKWPEGTKFAVRSSSPDEDSKEYSFAGVHESYINVSGSMEVIDKVRLVWASLWSDRSLLYKKEKSLDSIKSSMAVLVQKMEHREVSGLAFTADPTNKDKNHIVIEAIRGGLDLLVDNVKSPERLKINKGSGEIEDRNLLGGRIILDDTVVPMLYSRIMAIEGIFGEPVDIEWTGLGDLFTVLQVRPITVFRDDRNQERKWYMTLTPKGQKLIDLAEKVENILIPELAALSLEFSNTSPYSLPSEDFIDALRARGESYDKWVKIYWDEFIPFAHGIRNFGTFYNDLVKPEDPYRFVSLLKTDGLMAHKRNMDMADMARKLNLHWEFKKHLREIMDSGVKGENLIRIFEDVAGSDEPESGFASGFLEFLNEEMDITYENVRLDLAPEVSLGVILTMSDKSVDILRNSPELESHMDLVQEYMAKAEEQGKTEDGEIWLRIGRVSWKLRDDDNILMGKLENQLLVYMEKGAELLLNEGKINKIPVKLYAAEWDKVVKGLSGPGAVELSEGDKGLLQGEHLEGKARQLLGQPSSPGLFTGKARVILSLDDFKDIENGEVLVFDAVQPQMTFIVPLAGAIIERRGGMLVHSSIIAREMNIPAVNGVSRATEHIRTGDIVTVNGDLGIVVLGKAEF